MSDFRQQRRIAIRRMALTVAPPLRRIVEERATLRRAQVKLRKTLQRAEEDVASLRQRLATSENVDQLGYLFIVTYGRSGSTLLQGVLNSIPGYVIRGENREALYNLYQYHRTLVQERDANTRNHPLTTQSSWYGIDQYDADVAISAMRSLVVNTLLQPQSDTRVIGFKEIRWWRKDWQEYFEFLHSLFPRARFIINTRNNDDVLKSKWWTERDNATTMLRNYEQRLTDIATHLDSRAYRIHYDDYIDDHEKLRGLFTWLGEPFDLTAIESVMELKHSY